MTLTTSLTVGTQVYCTDRSCGKLAHISIEPTTNHVMEIVVEYGLPFFRHNRVLPFSTIRSVQEDAIHLSISSSEWSDYPEYHEIDVEEPDTTAGTGAQFGDGLGGEYRVPMVRRHLRQGIAADRAVIHAGIAIENSVDNGTEPIGHLDHILVKGKTGDITHVALRRGLLQRQYVLIPIHRITFSSDGLIESDVTTEELATFPHYEYPGEDEILVDLEQYLHEEASAFDDVHAHIEAGVLYLTGNVISRELKYHAGELARTIPGVGAVNNEIQVNGKGRIPVSTRQMPWGSDPAGEGEGGEAIDELAAEVNYALAVDQRTKQGMIEVLNDNGVIHLRGYVNNVAERQTAQNIAATQPGVTAVVNELAIQAGKPASPRPVVA